MCHNNLLVCKNKLIVVVFFLLDIFAMFDFNLRKIYKNINQNPL